MQINELIKLLEAVSKSEVRQFTYETSSEYLSISKTGATEKSEKATIRSNTVHPGSAVDPAVHDVLASKPDSSLPITAEEMPAEQNNKVVDVPAPFVGTIMFDDSKTGNRFVEVGDKVTKGQLLFVMESMKLFSDVTSPVNGKIAQICVENNQIVEFGTVILKIDEES